MTNSEYKYVTSLISELADDKLKFMFKMYKVGIRSSLRMNDFKKVKLRAQYLELLNKEMIRRDLI